MPFIGWVFQVPYSTSVFPPTCTEQVDVDAQGSIGKPVCPLTVMLLTLQRLYPRSQSLFTTGRCKHLPWYLMTRAYLPHTRCIYLKGPAHAWYSSHVEVRGQPQGSVLSSHHVHPRNGTPVVSLGSTRFTCGTILPAQPQIILRLTGVIQLHSPQASASLLS